MKKTVDVLATHFFWPKMRRNVERFVARFTICQIAKSRLNPHGLYMPLPVPSDEDINTIVTPTAPAAIHTGPITRARTRH